MKFEVEFYKTENGKEPKKRRADWIRRYKED